MNTFLRKPRSRRCTKLHSGRAKTMAATDPRLPRRNAHRSISHTRRSDTLSPTFSSSPTWAQTESSASTKRPTSPSSQPESVPIPVSVALPNSDRRPHARGVLRCAGYPLHRPIRALPLPKAVFKLQAELPKQVDSVQIQKPQECLQLGEGSQDHQSSQNGPLDDHCRDIQRQEGTAC